METIKLKYKVLGVLWTKHKTVELPQNANECSLEQLFRLAIYWAVDKPDYVIKIEVVAILLQVKKDFLRRFDREALWRLCELSEWVFEFPSFNKKKLPAFKVNGKWFHGPDECLFNCTFIEFVHADELASNYARTGVTAYLDQLIATLYRPTKSKKQLNADDYNGDVRRSYNYYLTSVYAKQIENLEMPYKTIVLVFFAGCKKYIMEQFKDVFGKSGESSGSSDNAYAIAQKVLAKEGTLGDLEKVQNENVYNALNMLQDIIRNSRKNV